MRKLRVSDRNILSNQSFLGAIEHCRHKWMFGGVKAQEIKNKIER